MKQTSSRLIAALALAGLGVAAIAQTPATVAPGAPPQHHLRDGGRGPMMGDPGEMRDRMRQHMGQRMERRLGALKQQLAITPQQEGAWNAWVNAMKPQPRQRLERPNAVQFARMTTPERIDRIKALRTQRQQRMDQRLDATRVFYGTLNAQQQRTFDEQSLDLLKRGGKRGMRGHHGRG